MTKPFLIADIGGTNARFSLAMRDQSEDGVSILERQDYRASDYDRLEDALAAYLEHIGNPRLQQACFAVAGPIKDRVVDFTNSAWTLDGNSLEKTFGLSEMKVVNDFRAMTFGSLFVPEKDLLTVKDGTTDPERPRAVMGPGTGLGLGLVVRSGNGWRSLATEGGHVSFSPRGARQRALLEHMTGVYAHVSFERLVSGKGILNIYRSLCAIDDVEAAHDRPEAVTEAAIEHNDKLAEEALGIFCEALGTYAGNIVLCTGARGGVFLAGGILPKIKDFFLESRFTDMFLDKSPMEGYVEDVPVKLIMSKDTALIGAAKLLEEQ